MKTEGHFSVRSVVDFYSPDDSELHTIGFVKFGILFWVFRVYIKKTCNIYICGLISLLVGISMYIRHRKGSVILPWGTSSETFIVLDFLSLILL